MTITGLLRSHHRHTECLYRQQSYAYCCSHWKQWFGHVQLDRWCILCRNYGRHQCFSTVNTTYTVTATDACPQTTTQTVTVVVNPLPTPSVTPAASATCGPVATQLIASGGTTHAWSPATGLKNHQ